MHNRAVYVRPTIITANADLQRSWVRAMDQNSWGRLSKLSPGPITLLLYAPLVMEQNSCLQFPSFIGSLLLLLLGFA